MDYKVGSLAELISGNKTTDKIKIIIQKTITPIKKEPIDKPGKSPKKNKVKKEPVDEPVPDITFKGKNPKKSKVKKEPVDELITSETTLDNNKKLSKKAKKRKSNDNLNSLGDSHDGIITSETLDNNKKLSKKAKKRKSNDKSNSLADSDDDQLPSKKQKLSKKKKSKSNDKSNGLADSDDDQSPSKKQKLSENEQNAAGRIKNKLNKQTKNSVEYKDKTVFVGNIPIKTKKEKIKKRFRKYGEIDSVRFRGIPVADPKTSKKVAAIKEEFHPDRNTLYAFIRFKKAEDAKKAEVENGLLFEDHHLRVHCCESEDKPDESKAIFVGNLAFSAEEEELWNLFKSCGPISHVRIVRDGRTGMGKGFGYVNFKDSDSVQLALEMENVKLKERELRISLCDATRAKKKKAPKKPRIRNRVPRKENQENSDDAPKKTNAFVAKKNKPEQFSGSKFDDKKKKKKFNRSAIEKKKLAKKLVAPKPSVQ